MNPGVFGKHIYQRQEVTIPSIVLGNVDHLNQIRRPLLVDPKDQYGSRGKPSSSGFMQRVPQISFQDFSGTFDRDLVGLGESGQSTQAAGFERVAVSRQQGASRKLLLLSLLHNLQRLYTLILHKSKQASLTRRYFSNESGCRFNHKI